LAERGQFQEAFRALSNHVRAATGAEEYRLEHIYWALYSGEDERALDLLTSTPINRDSPFLVTLHRRPLFNRFHDHPTMQDFLRRIGVAQYANCVHEACGNPSAS
ncbi:MAG: hypothetical protein V3R73_06395, partial [Sphingomonadales bacterium]